MAGGVSVNGSNLLSGSGGFYLLGASLVQPLFRGDELNAKRRSAVAAYGAPARLSESTIASSGAASIRHSDPIPASRA